MFTIDRNRCSRSTGWDVHDQTESVFTIHRNAHRRFDTALAVCVARLGVDAVCYSFIVADFHPYSLPVSPAHQKFFSSHAAVFNTFNLQRHLTSAQAHRVLRAESMDTWRTAAAIA